MLATKSTQRDAAGFAAELDRSLANLRTDRVDIVFIHGIQTPAEVDRVLAPGGALEAAVAAQQAGKVRFIGVTGHGRPDGLMHALRQHAFDVLMTGFNYLDRFNFPGIERDLVPLARERGTGLLAMKALADGYLYRSPEPALRYALALPVASVVVGANNLALLKKDIAIARVVDAHERRRARGAVPLGARAGRLRVPALRPVPGGVVRSRSRCSCSRDCSTGRWTTAGSTTRRATPCASA